MIRRGGKNVSYVQGSKGELIRAEHTCAKFQCRSQKNVVDSSNSVRKTCVICGVALGYLVSVWYQLLALNMTWYEPYSVRSSKIYDNVFTGMLWSTWNRLVQKKKNGKKTFIPTETSDHYWQFWRLVVSRDSSSPLAPTLLIGSPTEKQAVSPSPAVRGGQHDTKYVAFE